MPLRERLSADPQSGSVEAVLPDVGWAVGPSAIPKQRLPLKQDPGHLSSKLKDLSADPDQRLPLKRLC